VFDPIGHPTKGGFNGVRGQGDPFFLLQKILKKVIVCW
jgi:hypothetical protein